MEKFSLYTVAFMLGIILIRGTYERIYNIPKWFANPPSTFEIIRQQAKGSAQFWLPVQLLYIISFVAALITNWQSTTIRNYLIFAGVSYQIVIVVTMVYFVKEIMAFQKIPVDAPLTNELQHRVNKWYKWTIVRNILQGIAFVFLMLALFQL